MPELLPLVTDILLLGKHLYTYRVLRNGSYLPRDGVFGITRGMGSAAFRSPYLISVEWRVYSYLWRNQYSYHKDVLIVSIKVGNPSLVHSWDF